MCKQMSTTIIYGTDSMRCYNHPRHTATEQYDNNGKDWYFRFDDDNEMNYKYSLSTTLRR